MPTLAKLTCPSSSHAVQRERLLALLDQGSKRPVTWVSSPAGSGKTTLVSNWLNLRKCSFLWYQVDEGDGDLATFFYYMGLAAKDAAPRHKKPLPLLTPEYLLGIPAFTRRFFENLYGRLKPPFTIVFDNFQDVPDHSGFVEMMAQALDVIPEGVQVILISRGEIPAPLSRLQANGKVNQIRWNEIRFTQEESSALMDSHDRAKLAAEVQQQLYEKTDGWAAGLILMMESFRRDGFHANPELRTQREVFDYFASELFSKSEKTIQQILLKTAFLPRIEQATAVKLTGVATVGQLLDTLCRNNIFTQSYMQAYQYHPMFRDFLLTVARNTFSQAELTSTQLHAAELLAESGQIEEAVHLYRDAQSWEKLIGLILSQAQAMVALGRNGTLLEWISVIPNEIVGNMPWLIYWQGVCHLSIDPAKSRQISLSAFALFDQQKDDTGALLSWAATIQAFAIELNSYKEMDPLLQWFDRYLERNVPFPSLMIEAIVASAMAFALLGRRRSFSELKEWIERASLLAHKTGDVNLILQAGFNSTLFYIGTGDFAQVEEIVRSNLLLSHTPGVTPLLKLNTEIGNNFVQLLTVANEDALNSVFKTLDEVERNGIHIMDYFLFALATWGAFNIGDIKTAETFLARMQTSLSVQRCVGHSQYQTLMAWLNLLKNNWGLALTHAEKGLQFILDSGLVNETPSTIRFVLVQILHKLGEDEKVAAHLSIIADFLQTSKSDNIEYQYLIVKAQFAFDRGEQETGLEFLSKAMKLGRSRNYINMSWWWNPAVMVDLFSKALEHGIEVDYVHELIRKRKLVPEKPLKFWPRPVRIQTVGKLEIVKDGEPVVFKGKVQKKPIDLLMLLIECGGQTTAGRVSDVLWHEAEGDKAHNSFRMALSRLRQLIGKEAIDYQDGTISINQNYCWVDVLADRADIA